ncbi:PREDICTED: TMV resistance protein N-like [Lupinus angustifolius]|uniref:TMV resistance protein N-like n=1 Tax=Lupinus angustifolius TaxID=3871 RepID=UPI00092FB213|nr:PREDICTED: TMV resistance protein N-like [Lupinus angustifolius]
MASSSFSAATSIKKYDVFISFRGEDTRDNFTSHLHAALLRHEIETYIDYKLEKEDEVWLSLVEAIHDSSVFLVIFSENYASSTWCLNELVEIMECKKKGGYVIPIFYRIEPSHIRKQSGSYEKSFHKHEMDFKHNNETMQKWKDNLIEAANTSGFHSNSRQYRDESDMIDNIVKLVLQKLNSKCSYELRGCFIQDENYAKIISLLSIDSRDVRIIGIWGMGGIGKTTIAEAVFSEVASLFEGVCFFENLREQSKTYGLNHIYSRILSKLLGEDLHIDTPKLIPSFVVSRLSRKKVFIVLDDVNSIDLIENCVGLGNDWLGAGSRVIVTTRDKQVLINGGVDKIHEVKEMNIQNSLQLFSFYAFKKANPKKGYEELSKRAIVYANGIPLALKILGSLLHSKGKNEWKSALMKLKKFLNPKIQSLSYNELDDTDKKIFLDIACFFKSHDIYWFK